MIIKALISEATRALGGLLAKAASTCEQEGRPAPAQHRSMLHIGVQVVVWGVFPPPEARVHKLYKLGHAFCGLLVCNVEINVPAASLLGCTELIFTFSLVGGMTHP